MEQLTCALLVVGGGPGGYAAALRAADLGVDTVLVEAGHAGGTCLNIGCIPSKALIHVADELDRVRRSSAGDGGLGIRATPPHLDLVTARSWQQGVVGTLRSGLEARLRSTGVRVLAGWATLVDGKSAVVTTSAGEVRVTAAHVLLATGSRPIELPGLPWGSRVVSSTEALRVEAVPERLVVVGGGYIGLELGTAYAKLGSQVTIVEAADRLLPTLDADLGAAVGRGLEHHGVDVRLSTSAEALAPAGDALVTRTADGSTAALPADEVLVAVGRRPVTDGWGLEDLDLDRDGPFVAIDDRCQSSMAGVYAVGDLTGEPMLAHRASAQGELVAEVVAGLPRRWDQRCVPAVMFTDPEVVTVGASEDGDNPVVVGRAPLAASGRAHATGDAHGFVRVVARAEDHVIIGIHGVGREVSELSAGFAIAIEMGARLEDLTGSVLAHPTRSEALHEAAVAALAQSSRLTRSTKRSG